MQALFEFLAVVCSGIFTGAAIYINAVEHPARLSCGARAALDEWRPSYARATVMQASLAVLGGAFALCAWLFGASLEVLWAGLLLLCVVPYTLIGIMPTNKRLQALGGDAGDEEITGLLKRWNDLHLLRSALGLAAFGWPGSPRLFPTPRP